MKFRLEFDMDNAAFESWNEEAERILRELGALIGQEGDRAKRSVQDYNGNTIGKWEID